MKPSLLRRLVPLVALGVLLGAVSPLSARRVLIKLGTSAPKNSSWHDALSYMRQEWRKISGGDVKVNIYAGGVAGDDPELVRKIRRRGLDAIGVSGIGLSRIDKGAECLNIPMMVRSYEELDYIRERITPKIEARIPGQRAPRLRTYLPPRIPQGRRGQLGGHWPDHRDFAGGRRPKRDGPGRTRSRAGYAEH